MLMEIYYNFNRKCYLLSGNELKDLSEFSKGGANLLYICTSGGEHTKVTGDD